MHEFVAIGQDDDAEMLLRPTHDDVAKADAFTGVPHGVVAESPAESVAGVGIAAGIVRRERQLARILAEQLVGVERRIPFREVVDRGVYTAVAARGAGDALIGLR